MGIIKQTHGRLSTSDFVGSGILISGFLVLDEAASRFTLSFLFIASFERSVRVFIFIFILTRLLFTRLHQSVYLSEVEKNSIWGML